MPGGTAAVTAARTRLEIFKYVLYISVPLVFGYGLGRLPEFWQWSETIFPSAANNPKGPYLSREVTEGRPTLHSEFSNLRLEAAVDAALKESRREKAEALQAGKQ